MASTSNLSMALQRAHLFCWRLSFALTAVSKVWTERGRGIPAPAAESART